MIAIIGGGIGGLALANSFNYFGIDYQLFEKENEWKEVGAGIGLSESSLKIFGILGLEADLRKQGQQVSNAIIVDRNCKIIRKLPIESEGICTHRMNLIDILKKNLCHESLLLGHELIFFEKQENHFNLLFKNGTSIQSKLIIACDGINSKLRNMLFPNIRKRYSGQSIWRGITKISLGGIFENSYLEFWGDTLRFASIPVSNDNYYWYAVKETKEGEADNPLTIKDDLKWLFRKYHPITMKIIDGSDKIIRNDMYDLIPHNFPWHKDNIVFLGDAIHATTPNLAQGGCQAIEDAFTLAKIIYKRGLNNSSFDFYKSIRKNKVFNIVNQSWRYGKISHPKTKTTEFIVKSLFQILPKGYFVNQYKELVDIEYLNKF